MALGISFLIMLLGKNIKSTSVRIGFLVVATSAILYPNIKHIQEYMVPTVFNAEEVKVLDDLHKKADREDYVITWWDYGFPIRYYADVKTLVDGGAHAGSQNFAPSFILSSPSQKLSAKLARLEVEYREMSFTDKRTGYNIAKMMKDYGFNDPRKFIANLDKEIRLPKKTRDIYLYLPNRMLNIFATVNLFSNMNIVTGERYPSRYFSKTRAISDKQKELRFSDGSVLNKTNSTLKVRGGTVGIKNFFVVEYDRSGNLIKNKQKLRNDGGLSIVYMKSYKQFLILDDEMLNSAFIQLFVFENYDKELFEPITKSPYAKVYKLKI
jgi:dolichyl-diphosphooligosaccharide--protein glycosyltransferase/undecaprenyl-diphosphooligosaccharide--protein glycosyltransferase